MEHLWGFLNSVRVTETCSVCVCVFKGQHEQEDW